VRTLFTGRRLSLEVGALGQVTSVMAGKQHFVVLDGLRGVAAIGVTIYHGTFVFGGRTLLAQAYLAVDFFFLLSGVVVARAYERRLEAGKTFDYLVKRAIRLYPMIAIGAVLGASFYATAPDARGYVSLWVVAGLYVLATLCLPVLEDDTFPPSHGITPLNVPSWSLFFELVVNAIYGFTAKYLNSSVLLALIFVSFCIECVGIYHFRGANFGFHIPEFWWGFPRVTFPFFTGVWIHRIMTGDRLAGRTLPPSVLALALLLTFAISSPTHGKLNALEDLIDIALVYPAIIVLAMRANPGPLESAILIWVGALSYPIYIVHHPFFMWMARALRGSGVQPASHPFVCICIAILSSGAFAIGLYYAYDIPLRAWLTRIAKPAIGVAR
jgi:peptidoglycan/LPS O-acetylase OafA/YrhL